MKPEPGGIGASREKFLQATNSDGKPFGFTEREVSAVLVAYSINLENRFSMSSLSFV
jgi:hypothetical protein